ncbi:integrase [Gossypium australe]|uniref:Integrase n=1 Tax=Gossypium australe TaxID=47621 RepID=A0A5B6WGW7_9ROSI|nr:integrase [Gossypium australe]
MASYKALYGRKCRTSLYWIDLNENKIHRVDLITEIEEKVKSVFKSITVEEDSSIWSQRKINSAIYQII